MIRRLTRTFHERKLALGEISLSLNAGKQGHLWK